jgi:hypothetical protein
MNSENLEICQDVMISYMKAMLQIWKGFEHFVKYNV